MSGYLINVSGTINALPFTMLMGIPDGVYANAVAALNATSSAAIAYEAGKGQTFVVTSTTVVQIR
jgi:hypothetical protein